MRRGREAFCSEAHAEAFSREVAGLQSAKSRREDAELAARFGPAFLPRLGRRHHPDVAERAGQAEVQTTTQSH